MNRITKTSWMAAALAAAGLLLVLPAGAFAQASKQNQKQQDFEPAQDWTRNRFETDFNTLDQGFWDNLTDEPQDEFQSALESLKKGDGDDVAKHIRKGATVVRLAAGHSVPESRKYLVAALYELRDVAKEAADGDVTAADQLKEPFARTEAALALNELARAQEAWAKPDDDDAAKHLQRSVTEFTDALALTGRPPRGQEAGMAEEARGVVTQLTVTKTFNRADVDDVLARYETTLRAFQDSIQPAK